MATYTGLSGSDPSYALSSSCVNGSSLAGSKSSRGACMIVLMVEVAVVAVVAVSPWSFFPTGESSGLSGSAVTEKEDKGKGKCESETVERSVVEGQQLMASSYSVIAGCCHLAPTRATPSTRYAQGRQSYDDTYCVAPF